MGKKGNGCKEKAVDLDSMVGGSGTPLLRKPHQTEPGCNTAPKRGCTGLE